MRATIMVFAVIVSLVGCAASSGVQVAPEKVSQFKVGVSTEPEVIAALGPPTGTTVNGEGRMITYTGATAQVRGATFIPIVGLFAGGHDIKSSSTVFKFGIDGKLKDVSTTNSNTGTSLGGQPIDDTTNQPRQVQ